MTINLNSTLILAYSSNIIHTFIMLSVVLYPFILSINKYKSHIFLDIIVLLTVLSFLIYKRCVAIDITNYFLKDINNHLLNKHQKILLRDDLPHYLIDKYIHKKIKLDITNARADIIHKNLNYFANPQLNKILENKRITYIVHNILLLLLLLYKYKLMHITPFIVLWYNNNFTSKIYIDEKKVKYYKKKFKL